jgi:hypothetical protein
VMEVDTNNAVGAMTAAALGGLVLGSAGGGWGAPLPGAA